MHCCLSTFPPMFKDFIHYDYSFSDRILSSTFECAGFAFVYMDDERDAEDAIRGLDRMEFGRQGRRLRVEWTKVCDLQII